MIAKLCAGLYLGAAAITASAQTPVGGPIAADTVWRTANSPYIVNSDVIVQSGATLTIEAGTTVYMGAETRFTVQSGALRAIGTADAPIRLTSLKAQAGQAAAPGDWQQLTFGIGTTGGTRLDHVRVEYGKGIVVSGASPVFNYLDIQNNLGAAIAVDLASSPAGVGNHASGNTRDAVVVPAGEISGSVTWGLRGIPYLIEAGLVSVGALPRILSISPNSMQRGETKTLTVAGSRLAGFAQPAFDLPGVSAQVLPGSTETQAQIQVTASAEATIGLATFSAKTDAGEVQSTGALSVVSLQPILQSVTPSTLSTGQGDATVTLKGQNFTPQSVAYLDAVALATTYVGPAEITAVAPNQTVSGVKSITLHTPDQQGGAEFISNPQTLSFVTQPPVVTAVTPGSLRRGETKNFRISGTGLGGIRLSTPIPALTISGLALSPTEATFDLTAAEDAPLGPQQLTLRNDAAIATVTITVNPALPTASVSPTPIAIPPDSSTRQFAVRLSFADTVDHIFAVTAADPSIVAVSPSSLTLAAGQEQAIGSLTGLKAGITSLKLVSPTLGTLTLPVYVTADFLGLNTSYAQPLGVVRAVVPDVPQQTGAAVAKNVGVVFGNFVKDMTPKTFSVDSGTSTLTILGEGLQGAISAVVKPADGVTVGSVAVASDGKSVTVPLTIAANAPVTLRQVVLSSAAGAYPIASPEADRIEITLPRPEIHSISPLFGTPGTSSLNIVLRGRNLQAVEALTSVPTDGISFGASPSASADGTQLTAVMSIASSANLGPRTIVATAPGSSSDTVANAANTFTVVNSLSSTFTPIVSPSLGVLKQDNAQPAGVTQSVNALPLSIAYGSAGISIAPKAKAIGDSTTMTIQGVGLQNVTSVSFVPDTGITVGTPAIAAEGRSLNFDISIASDAPQTVRAVRLMAGSAPVPFVQPANALFSVTAPQPVIESSDPTALLLGASPVLMTIRGQNFQNATSVRFAPSDGMTVSMPPAVINSTQLTVNVSAAANATPGQRAVIVTTPGGESSADLTAANTVWLGNSISTGQLFSPLVGVLKQENAVPPGATYGLVSSSLGVRFGEEAPIQPPQATKASLPLGVAFGPVATAIVPESFARSSSGVLTVTGFGLNGVTGISVLPADGVTIGTPLQISADGRQASVPIAVAADAPMTMRRVVINTVGGAVQFARAASASVQVTSDAVLPISSISPILATRGSLITLTVRGQNMQNTLAVIASPADGLTFDTQPTVNASGTELTVRLQVAADAPASPRVIRVITPTSISSDQSSSANTFTVYAE